MIIYFTKIHFILIVRKIQDSRFTSVLWSLVSILESERSLKNIKLDLVTPTLQSSKDFLVLQIKNQGLDKNQKLPDNSFTYLPTPILCIVLWTRFCKESYWGHLGCRVVPSPAYDIIIDHHWSYHVVKPLFYPVSSLCFQDLFPLWCLSPAHALLYLNNLS